MSKLFPLSVVLVCLMAATATAADSPIDQVQLNRGIVGLVGVDADETMSLAKRSELLIYAQFSDPAAARAVREAAEQARFLNTRIFVDTAPDSEILLADNVADVIVVAPAASKSLSENEIRRALRPKGTAYLPDRALTKHVPDGYEDWSHPFHGPDNNPNSGDTHVRGTFRTQFIAEPKFSPMPEQSVIGGGRIYKAMGHIAHKANQNPMLNTLLCVNAYNGTILWKRPLPEGFMIHRNTMVATDDALYMGDHESCKVFDGRTGKLRAEIKVDNTISDGPVWKWMAIQNGTLYALVGNPEIKVDTQVSKRRGLGHWPWGMWKGHDYKDPRTSFGFGRTFVAIDLKTNKRLWHYRDKEFIDARGVCMKNGRIYFYSPEKFLAALDADEGKLLWKNDDEKLLAAIGENQRAQHYVTGYATTTYMKCNDDYIFFAGPQRKQLAVASTADGYLVWAHEHGNLQLVLRDDGVYAAGPTTTGVKLDYETGEKLGSLPTRRACTRATGSVDSIFYRTSGGTVRVVTETNTAQHIAPMRPPCQDGVLISNGHLYWGPWMCGCQLSLYGNIALGPSHSQRLADKTPALVTYGETKIQTELAVHKDDWTSYRGSNARDDVSPVPVPESVQLDWTIDVSADVLPTAPVTAGGLVFIADRRGTVRAFDSGGQLKWKAYTSGPIYYPPAVAGSRLYVGSADGRVYAYEAATGRPLWSYRVGPAVRRVPVFGSLISTWPVSGGVVVENGTVYAAAGIAHYDGTYVVALDAATGKLKAENDISGNLAPQVADGVSMQGNLSIVEGELRFLGGGVYETACYDLETLECLNEPQNVVTSRYRTAFYPYYPSYGKYVSLEYTTGDGGLLCHDASYEGSMFANLCLQAPLPPGTPRIQKDEARDFLRRRGRKQPESIWKDQANRRFTSFAVHDNTLLAAGHPDLKENESFLAALDVKTGKDKWLEKLPAVPVKGGTALDRDGNVYVALENGTLLRFRNSR